MEDEKDQPRIGNSSFNIKSDQLWKHFGGFAFSKMLASFCCCFLEIGFKIFLGEYLLFSLKQPNNKIAIYNSNFDPIEMENMSQIGICTGVLTFNP